MIMTQIATKFVDWDVPELTSLQESKAYRLRKHLNDGGRLNREQKNWLTQAVNNNTFFKQGIPLMGYRFDFSDVLRCFYVKQYGQIQEYYAADKTSLCLLLHGKIEHIIEVIMPKREYHVI